MKQIITIIGLFCLILQPIIAQNDTTKFSYNDQTNKKINEINENITLEANQVDILRKAYVAHQMSTDSIASNCTNAKQASKSRLKVDKIWYMTLMNTLTDQQRLKYLTSIVTTEATVNTVTKMDLLRQSGNHTISELQQMQQEIFNHLTKEKVISLRYQYDVAKKRENLTWLRTIRPASLKECDLMEELQAKGKLTNGKINW